jgi:hypothetical protein
MGYPHFRTPPNFAPFNGHAPLFKQSTLRTLVKAGTSSVPTNWLGEAGIARWRHKLPLEAANTQGRRQRQKHVGNQSLSCWALLNSEHYCGHGTQPDLLVPTLRCEDRPPAKHAPLRCLINSSTGCLHRGLLVLSNCIVLALAYCQAWRLETHG